MRVWSGTRSSSATMKRGAEKQLTKDNPDDVRGFFLSLLTRNINRAAQEDLEYGGQVGLQKAEDSVLATRKYGIESIYHTEC